MNAISILDSPYSCDYAVNPKLFVLVMAGRVRHEVIFPSRAEASKCMHKILRRQVMVSSARQAVAGVLSAGGINAARYLANKVSKAWKSRV